MVDDNLYLIKAIYPSTRQRQYLQGLQDLVDKNILYRGGQFFSLQRDRFIAQWWTNHIAIFGGRTWAVVDKTGRGQ